MRFSDLADTVNEAAISFIEAPRLEGVSIRNFTKSKQQRELHEKQINEKSRQLNWDIVATSYRARIVDDELTIFIAAGWINAASINRRTEAHVDICDSERCNGMSKGKELHLVEEVVK